MLLTASCFFSLSHANVESLLEKSEKLELHKEKRWHQLLHYRQSLWGIESDVTSTSFFTSPTGSSDPKAELDATLRSFFRSNKVSSDDHPQCRFIARYHWLKKKLGWDERVLKTVNCPKFERWSKNNG
ncbi:MAG: hypothetical protein KC478_06210, partial [Bacteriovoracaceae bacterium]|nr:hypothetical protein [Bacteriovoracaceae bacterium]